MDSTTVVWLLDKVDLISTKVQEVAPEIWEMAYRQAYTEPYVETILFGSLLGVCLIGVLIGVIIGERNDWYEDYYFILPVASGITSFMLSIIFTVKLYNLIMFNLNPNYYALQKVFEIIGLK